MYAPEKIPADPQVAQAREKPLAYQFYRGVELHPRLLGVGKFLIAVAVHNATFEFKFHPSMHRQFLFPSRVNLRLSIPNK